MMSLQRRLSRGLLWILTIIFITNWFAADWVIRSVAEEEMADRLTDDGYSLMESLIENSAEKIGFDDFHLSTVYKLPMSGHFYQVKVDEKIYPSPSLAGQTLDLPPMGPEQSQVYHIDGPEGRPLLVYSLGLTVSEQWINISVAEDLSAVDHDITHIRMVYFGLTLVILICAVALQRWDIKRALSPVLAIKDELKRVAAGHVPQLKDDAPQEIRPLVNEINRLLELVERRLQQSRTAMGNLAHALKAPIAILFRVAGHPVFDQHPELREQLNAQIDSIHHCIERELKRARIAGNQQANLSFNPYREVKALVQLMKNLHADKNLLIDFAAPNVNVPFDREDVLEMLGNLVDNACKWAERQVVVQVEAADGLRIEVSDDGPGCSEADAQKLTQRGLRLDESIKGHGLGLAIVSDIVSAYKGELSFGRSEALGGLSVSVYLPLPVFVEP